MSLKGSVTTSDYLPYEDFKRLVSTLILEKHYWWATYCVLAFCTGLRFSDLKRIRWRDVLGERRIIITAKKTRKTHVIPIGQNIQEHLRNLHIKLGRPKLDGIVIARQDSDGREAVSPQYVNRELKKFIHKYNLDIENISTHTFRKTFGRYIYESQGKTEEALIYLNQIFRHGDISTTRIYIGLRNDEISNIYHGIKL